jgi:hypothetical protein
MNTMLAAETICTLTAFYIPSPTANRYLYHQKENLYDACNLFFHP